MKLVAMGLPLFLILGACSSSDEAEEDNMANTGLSDLKAGAANARSERPAVGDEAIVFPASLAPFGNGFPRSGDLCRRLGESPATSNYLDDSALLVGCPTQNDASGLGGNIVATVDGVTLVSIGREPDLQTAASNGTKRVTGVVTGSDVARHVFRADAGQTMNVSLIGNGTMYFNVLPPGGQAGDAIYVGSRAIEDPDFWSCVASDTGDYQVLVYLVTNDRDTGAKRQ